MIKTILTIILLLSFTTLYAQIDCNQTNLRNINEAIVLGNGNPGSVNTTMIQNALNMGGPIQFNIGSSPTVINLTSTLVITKQTIIDGGGLVTLSGQNQRRIIIIENPNNLIYTVSIQNLSLKDGFTATESGAAIFKASGGPWQAVSLEVINSTLSNNHAIQIEQDAGGGAIYAIGMDKVYLSHSRFENNSGSNGGAFYSLGSKEVRITDSIFDGNSATGNSGNPGNGGNAGAIGVDGADRAFNLCRSQIINNSANAFGVGFFTVMYDSSSLTAFTDVLFENNINPQDFGLAGGAYIQGGPFIINRSSFIENQARGAGGLFIGPNANGEIVNSTIYANIATNTLGGGIAIDASATVTIRHATIANNQAPCDVCFAGGISIGSNNQTTMYNSILANNIGGNLFNPWNILNPISGSNNLQFPQLRPNGQSEVQATALTNWSNPLLNIPNNNGGWTPTLSIEDSSPAINQANDVQSTSQDQRLAFRYQQADLGAYEWLPDLIFLHGFE